MGNFPLAHKSRMLLLLTECSPPPSLPARSQAASSLLPDLLRGVIATNAYDLRRITAAEESAMALDAAICCQWLAAEGMYSRQWRRWQRRQRHRRHHRRQRHKRRIRWRIVYRRFFLTLRRRRRQVGVATMTHISFVDFQSRQVFFLMDWSLPQVFPPAPASLSRFCLLVARPPGTLS